MKVFKQILEETFDSTDSWNYYSREMIFIYPFNSDIDSKLFIKSFLDISGKTAVVFNELIDKLPDGRAVHIVSTFFLGHYFYLTPTFKNKIDKEITQLTKGLKIETNVEFSYIWFLVCLFHDIGYAIEEGKMPLDETIEQLISAKSSLEVITGIPKFYGIIYKNYFKYITEVYCKNDHGITAAHILFNQLCAIRESADKEGISKLCWHEDLEKVYNFTAWNILAHNIWFGDKQKECDLRYYTEFRIKRMLFDGKYKIKMKNHPFFFLFCLVDTIEPFKQIRDFKLLEKIGLEINNKRIRILSNLGCGCEDKLLDNAEKLEKWLTKTERNNNYVDIYLN